MAGKVLKIASNDLYGNVDDRTASVFACFEHTKYMNNYVIFSINEDTNKKKLCYGSIHLKNNSLVIFEVKSNVKKFIDEFLNEYISDKLNNFKILDISMINKVELVSYNEMEYDNIQILDNKSIPKVIVQEDVGVSKKSVFIYYLLIFVLLLIAFGLTVLYFKPELFTIKYKGLECTNNLYDSNIELSYDIDKNVKFNSSDKVISISVVRTYTFLDSSSYEKFKNSDNNQYFNNGEGYKYIDDELRFKVFYEEKSVIDDYEEMLTYLNREGYSCVEKEYEE